jgi:hypothetical protein
MPDGVYDYLQSTRCAQPWQQAIVSHCFSSLLMPSQVRKMAPGTWGAMATNGLEPMELRAIAHALKLANVGRPPAMRFETSIDEKVCHWCCYPSPLMATDGH